MSSPITAISQFEALCVLVFVVLGSCRADWNWIWSFAALSLTGTFYRIYSAYEPFSIRPPTLMIAIVATTKIAVIYFSVFWIARIVSRLMRGIDNQG
jgi:hypothetical protein